MSLSQFLSNSLNKINETSVANLSPVTAMLPEKVKEKLPTVGGVGRGTNSLAKMIANGLATFSASAGDVVGRGALYGAGKATGDEELAKKAVTQKTGTRELPGPIGKWVGPITPYSDQYMNRREEGQSVAEAGLKTVGTAALDNPFGTELKMLGVGGSLILKKGAELAGPAIEKIALSKSATNIKKWLGDVLEGGSKEEVDTLAKSLVNTKTADEVKSEIDNFTKASTETKVTEPVVPKEVVDDRFTKTVSRLNIPDANKDALIKEVRDASTGVSEIIGKPVTSDEVIKMSKKVSSELPKFTTREETLKQMAEYKKGMDTLASSLSRGAMDKDELKSVLEFIESTKTYSGRMLNNIKQIGETLSPEMKTFTKIVDTLSKEGRTIEDILKTAEKYDLNSLEGQQMLFRELSNSGLEKWFDKVRMSSMLSSPSTHTSNFMSNAVNTFAVRPIVKAVAGGFDAARSAITGGERTQLAGEAAPYVSEIFKKENWAKAYAEASNVMKGRASFENTDLRSFRLTDTPNKTWADAVKSIGGKDKVTGEELKTLAKRTLEDALEIPVRLTSAVDAFTSIIGKEAEEAALKFRVNKNVLLDDQAHHNIQVLIRDLANKEIDIAAFRSKLYDESEGAMSRAIGSLGEIVQKGQYSKSGPLRIAAKMTTPFIKTMTNISKFGLNYTPLAVLDMVGAKNKTELLAKATIGTSIMGTALNYGAEGKITGPYPKEQKEQEVWKEKGIQPYSFKVGDKWVSYERMSPAISFPLAIAGTYTQKDAETKYSDSKLADMSTAMGLSIMKFIGEQGYARSVGDIFSAINGDEAKLSRLMASIPQQVVPFRALLSWVDRGTSDVVADVDKDKNVFSQAVQQFVNQLPDFIANPAEVQRNKAGEMRKNPQEWRADNIVPSTLSSLGVKTISISKENMKEFLDYKDAQSFKKAYNKEKAALDKKIEDTVATLKAPDIPRDRKREALAEIIRTNPEIAAKIIEKIASVKKDPLTYDMQIIKSMSTKDGSRNEYIKKRLLDFESKEDKKAFLVRLIEAGLLKE